jgi:hypothetical protein
LFLSFSIVDDKGIFTHILLYLHKEKSF